MFTVSLLEPQIPQNTGNIGRLCAATNTPLDIVGNIGFKLSDRYLKRAGLDYWEFLNWQYYEDQQTYMAELDPKKIHLFSARSETSYTEKQFKPGDTLIFGSETRGISRRYLDQYPERCCTIPMSNPGVRSLNLSSSVAIVLYEAIRQNL
jgi:tRNA (cytidine/uridine-2'-O-)-methyltransferase